MSQHFCKMPITHLHGLFRAHAESCHAESLIARGWVAKASEILDQAWLHAIQSRATLAQHVILSLCGEAALHAGQPDKAVRYFQDAIALAHKSGLTNRYLGSLARALAAQEHYPEARQKLAEGVSGLDAAEVYLILGETSLARQHVLHAYKEAWADGPPFIWSWPLQRARAVLAALDEPEPSLPPFDPDKVEPIPHEAEIRAFIERLRAKNKR